jgi:hypothetical protein
MESQVPLPGRLSGAGLCAPLSSYVRPLLTDFYQISMAYAYWNSGRHNCRATFDLYFRKCRTLVRKLISPEQSLVVRVFLPSSCSNFVWLLLLLCTASLYYSLQWRVRRFRWARRGPAVYPKL